MKWSGEIYLVKILLYIINMSSILDNPARYHTETETAAMFEIVRKFVASKSPEEVSEIKRILAKYENGYATVSHRIFYLNSDITTFESQLSQWFYEKPYAGRVYTTTVEKPGLLANNMFRQRAAITQRLATAYAEIDPLLKDMEIFERFYNGYTTFFDDTTDKQRLDAVNQYEFFEYIVSQPNNVESPSNSGGKKSNNGKKTMKSKKGKKHMNSKKDKKSMRRK